MTKKPTPRLSALLDRVQSECEGTSNYGKKSELARFLGVTPQFIHNWIVSREYEPGGEITLAMLEWVTALQANKKALDSVSSTVQSRKTRKDQSSREKTIRVRKRT